MRPVDINASAWDCSLEPDDAGAPALRLGLRMVKGLSEDAGARIVAARTDGLFAEVQQLRERAGLDRRELGVLASAGALKPISGDRHRARWAVAGAEKPMALFPDMTRYEPMPLLRRPTEGQNIVSDYRTTGLTLERHPMCLLRRHLDRYAYVRADALSSLDDGAGVNVAGLVITKQRPGTASGVIFVTLEDESGQVNVIVWKQVAEKYRAALLNARLLGVVGELQIEGQVIHVIARQLFDHSTLLGDLTVVSRDFR